MHHIYDNTQTKPAGTNYTLFIETIKKTPRHYNVDYSFKQILKHITWVLNIDINIIEFKKVTSTHYCQHKDQVCYYLAFAFQNTFVKLLRKNSLWPSFTFFLHNKQCFVAKNTDVMLAPHLINLQPPNQNTDFLTVDNTPIFYADITKLLHRTPVKFPFSFIIFSSYSFVKTSFQKQIKNTIVSKYKCDSSTSNKMWSFFIAPHVDKPTFSLYILDLPTTNSWLFNPKDILSHSHLIEGKKVKSSIDSQHEKVNPVLDQEFCVCDHAETQAIWKLPRFDNLASTYFQSRFLLENLEALGLLNTLLKRRLKVCSEISFLSYDTEALNQSYVSNLDSTLYDTSKMTNSFSNMAQKNIIYGQQQLYLIGVCDMIQIPQILCILKKYIPHGLIQKITNYVVSSDTTIKGHLSWKFCESRLQTIQLEGCALELLNFFETINITDRNVKTFHIGQNKDGQRVVEPNHANSTQMIYRFLIFIYQRNIIASIVKFILLKPLLNQFKSSQLCNHKQGIFYLIYKRLEEIVFESVLTAFNGQNYDNLLICNSLVTIIGQLNEHIRIFKKGSSFSTIHVFIKHNLNRFHNIYDSKPRRKIPAKSRLNQHWEMKLYIKDFRNLVAANMSLDRLGKLFNLKVAKLCFPYEQATSIRKLKTIKSLRVHDDQFWQDTFTSKTVDMSTRLNADLIFKEKQFKNLYDYGEYYLIQDCLLLHSVVFTLFRTYLNSSINIFLRRNYSQSNLSFQEFFIIEPSRQIDKIIAPKKIVSNLYNYMFKQAVTGGLCTSFVHGKIDNKTVINNHLNSVDLNYMNKTMWSNFANLEQMKQGHAFCEYPSGISTIDIRSLYPSAAVKKIPVGIPLFFTRLIPKDFDTHKTYKRIVGIQNLCENVRHCGDHNQDFMLHVNPSAQFHTEFYALTHYLSQIPSRVKILRFQSSFTALGQLYFTKYPLDGFLSYFDPQDNITYIKLIQYHSLFYHGHRDSCQVVSDPKSVQNAEKTKLVKISIINLINHFKEHFSLDSVNMEYVEIFDCDFFMHKIPRQNRLCFPYKHSYGYNEFLRAVQNKKLTGLLVVKNLTIKKSSQNPMFGFIIQKVNYGFDVLSPYTQEKTPYFKKSQRVISVNECTSFMVISTEYLNWLDQHFGFEHPPDIYHALLFQLDNYLQPYIERKLIERKSLKALISTEKNVEKKQIFEIQAELIKLMLNSCYGFTLTNVASNKFKVFENRKQLAKTIKAKQRIKSCIQFKDNIYLVELRKQIDDPFQTLLGHVGSYILYHSKIILAKRLHFLLRFLNPTKAQLLYMDTDSAHLLLKHKTFIDNVDDHLKQAFEKLFPKHFDSGNKISGIWVQEGFFEKAHYIGEKSYVLSNDSNTSYVAHMKGLNQHFQNQFVQQKIDPNEYPIIQYNIFQKTQDCLILKTCVSKNLFQTYVPIKRFFINATGSLPLKIKK